MTSHRAQSRTRLSAQVGAWPPRYNRSSAKRSIQPTLGSGSLWAFVRRWRGFAVAIIPLFIFGIFFLILGGLSFFLAWMAVKKHKRYRLLSDTHMTDIGALRPGLAK